MAHVVVGIHLGFHPEEQEVLQPDGVLAVCQRVPLLVRGFAKAVEVIPAQGAVLLEGDLDALQVVNAARRLDAGQVGLLPSGADNSKSISNHICYKDRAR